MTPSRSAVQLIAVTRRRRRHPSDVQHDPRASYLRRRRVTRAGAAVALLCLALAAVLDRTGLFGYRGNDHATADRQTHVVTHVVDGDTIHLRPKDAANEEKVRLIGVDTPEMNYGQQRPPDHWAIEARAFSEHRLLGREVLLRLDGTQTRDRYGRLLAYVYLSDSENFNLVLVREGQGYADRRFGHTFTDEFERAELEARRKGTGLWQSVKPEQMPDWKRTRDRIKPSDR